MNIQETTKGSTLWQAYFLAERALREAGRGRDMQSSPGLSDAVIEAEAAYFAYIRKPQGR